jgi:hypothetical protein
MKEGVRMVHLGARMVLEPIAVKRRHQPLILA